MKLADVFSAGRTPQRKSGPTQTRDGAGCAAFLPAGRLRYLREGGNLRIRLMRTPVGNDETLVADLLAIDPALRHRLEDRGGVSSIGRGLAVKGNINATTHLVVDGHVEGQINAPEHGVAVGTHGTLRSDIFAQSITVRGNVKGNLTATRSVKILADGRVEGRLVAPRLAIDEGAVFNGQVDPKRAEAAAAVQLHRLKTRTSRAGS